MPSSPDSTSLFLTQLEVLEYLQAEVSRLGLADELKAVVFNHCWAASLKQSYQSVDDLLALVSTCASAVFRKHLDGIAEPREVSGFEPPRKVGIFTGQFDPPTRAHSDFISHILAMGLHPVVGPDAERTDRTPWRLRRFLVQAFLQAEFKESYDSGKLSSYPESDEFVGGIFPQRLEHLRQRFGSDRVVFCCGADTLRIILEIYPQAVLSGPILCLQRSTPAGDTLEIPVMSREFFINLMKQFFRNEGEILEKLFHDHPLEPILETWCRFFPSCSSDDVDRFFSQQPITAKGLAHRLLGSERLMQRGRARYDEIREKLERFYTHAQLALNPFALELLQSHIFYVNTPESSHSSTRDRILVAGLPDMSDDLRPYLIGSKNATLNPDMLQTIRDYCEDSDWHGLENALASLRETDPVNLIAAVRDIVHHRTLQVLIDYDLLDLYRSRPQTRLVPVGQEVLQAARSIGESVCVLDPTDIDSLSPPAQYHLARAMAGVNYAWEPDHPDSDIHNPRHLVDLLTRRGAGRRFRPSLLIDSETGHILAILPAFKPADSPTIKYLGVSVDPDTSRNPSRVALVNGFVDHRIREDRFRSDDSIEFLLAEVPAHDTRFIEQHLLGGASFLPCGLEPNMDPSRSYVGFSVQGIHLRRPRLQQGDCYVVPEAESLVSSVMNLVGNAYKTPFFYRLLSAHTSPETAKYSRLNPLSAQSPEYLSSDSEGILFRVGSWHFRVFPERSRHFNLEDFLDPEAGPFLLEKAVEVAGQLHEDGRLGRPYLKFSLPVNSPYMLRLQEVLIRCKFHPVRFIPATLKMPPMLTFCKILGQPSMNQVELPLASSTGFSDDLISVLGCLQTIGSALSQEGVISSEAASTRQEAIRLGKRTLRKSPMHRALSETAFWSVFPSIYGHYYEIMKTLQVYRKHLNPQFRPALRGRFLDHFVGLHDLGKSIWVIAKQFVHAKLNDVREPLSSEVLKEHFREYLRTSFADENPAPGWETMSSSLEECVLNQLSFDSTQTCYVVPPDIGISASLIRRYLGEAGSTSDVIPSDLIQAGVLYERSSRGAFEDLFSTIEENPSLLVSWLEDEDLFAVLFLELVDNTSRYRLINPDGSLSLRNIHIALDLKKGDVLGKYGHNEQDCARINQKFSALARVAEVFFATHPPHPADS